MSQARSRGTLALLQRGCSGLLETFSYTMRSFEGISGQHHEREEAHELQCEPADSHAVDLGGSLGPCGPLMPWLRSRELGGAHLLGYWMPSRELLSLLPHVLQERQMAPLQA